MPGIVAILPDVFAAANAAGEGNLFRAWSAARHAMIRPGERGTGRLTADAFAQAIASLLAVSERQALALLDSGDQHWWTHDRKGGYVYLHAPVRILTRLGAATSDNPPADVNEADLARLEGFRAACYAAYMRRYVHVGKDGQATARPVSRDQLMRTFGVTQPTLRRWEKRAGVVVLNNWAFAPPAEFRTMPDRHHELHCQCGRVFSSERLAEFASHHRECGREFAVVWQRANSYLPLPPPESHPVNQVNPSGRRRLQTYRKRHAQDPRANQTPRARPSGTGCEGAYVGDPYGWLQPGHETTYRRAKIGDPLPPVLAGRLPLSRLWRGRNL